MYLVSPTEPEKLRQIGELSWITEDYGVDVLFAERNKLIGVQRKTFPADFIASLYDGRLTKEVAQMKKLDMAMIVLEGRAHWTLDGELMMDYRSSNINRAAFRNLCHSFWFVYGIAMGYTDTIDDTIAAIATFRSWAQKEQHVSLMRRPKAQDPWQGQVQGRDFGIFFLQGLPGVGPHLATAIYDYFGRIPLRWDIDRDELSKVPGVGKIRLERLWAAFDSKGGQCSE